MLKAGHSVTRPGRRPFDGPAAIPVPEELETVTGVVQDPGDVDFYSREYPLDHEDMVWSADLQWHFEAFTKELIEEWKIHGELSQPNIFAARSSGDVEPKAKPMPGKDVTQEIKAKARELGFGEVGVTKLDRRYVYKSRKDWVRFPHAICLAYEQDYEATQRTPSGDSDGTHHGTYRMIGEMALHLAHYIWSLGYHAQVHSPTSGGTAVYIPLFVEAGLGQLGANGQLLSPHFGSRARLMIITTDALVIYDKPEDYGINAFCNICQVCVNRCPGRALIRDKVWWRGVQKNKVMYKRCRPVVVRYEGCGVCMKVCPIQKYGMKPVMEHYIATGQVLGKGTHLLEGYELRDMGYFGPGELPTFDNEFFHFPHGRSEDVAFEELKEKIQADEVLDNEDGDMVLSEFKAKVEKYIKDRKDPLPGPLEVSSR